MSESVCTHAVACGCKVLHTVAGFCPAPLLEKPPRSSLFAQHFSGSGGLLRALIHMSGVPLLGLLSALIHMSGVPLLSV